MEIYTNIDQLPWPERGDRLFVADEPDFLNNAFLGSNWIVYADGYKQAADNLVKKLLEDRHSQDFLVYPVVFLYRHYIELCLKHIILLGNRLLKNEFLLPNHHRIDHLWRDARRILEEANPDGSKADLDAVEACLKELAKRDPTSESFRYPINLAREPHFDQREQVNLRHFSDTVRKIGGLFDGAIGYLMEYLDTKHQMESDHGP
jgi:hypothetical protein